MKIYIMALATQLFMNNTLLAQQKENKPLTISGYAEVYYLHDFNRPLYNTRPAFVYSHNRANEFNINLAFIKAAYSTENVRSNIAVAAGTYMNANYSAEPSVLKNIYEANVGVKISKKKNLWIDAGVMPSHIGFESAVGKDNWTVTRSLIAENSPYFETGAKISYTTSNKKWYIGGLVLNGWQRIQRIDGNTTLAFGHQLTYKPNKKITLNSSSFIGNDKPDSVKQMRYFHNLYGIFQLSDQWYITAAIDMGAEQKAHRSTKYNTWFTPVIIIKYIADEKWSLAGRAEYYEDKTGVIIATGTKNGFQAFGYSFNADYAVSDNVLWRTELRNLKSKDAIFIKRDAINSKENWMAVTSLAISF